MSPNIPGNVAKHSGECCQIFRATLPNIPGNVTKHSEEWPETFRGMLLNTIIIIIIIIIINLTFAFPLSRSSIHLARHYSMFFTFLCEGKGSWTINTAWKASKYAVFSGPYFPVIGLNTEIYAINLRIKAKYTKIRTRKNSVFGHFTQCKITKCSFYLK